MQNMCYKNLFFLIFETIYEYLSLLVNLQNIVKIRYILSIYTSTNVFRILFLIDLLIHYRYIFNPSYLGRSVINSVHNINCGEDNRMI
jgi:hypothetical protein